MLKEREWYPFCFKPAHLTIRKSQTQALMPRNPKSYHPTNELQWSISS